MTTHMVVDSSVAVKWFKPDGEAGVASALDLLNRHYDEAILLAAPTLLRLEVLNALWSARFDQDQLRTAAENLEGFRLSWFDVDARLAEDAARIAASSGLTVYDAAFVALALQLDAELITADRRLSEADACRCRLIG